MFKWKKKKKNILYDGVLFPFYFSSMLFSVLFCLIQAYSDRACSSRTCYSPIDCAIECCSPTTKTEKTTRITKRTKRKRRTPIAPMTVHVVVGVVVDARDVLEIEYLRFSTSEIASLRLASSPLRTHSSLRRRWTFDLQRLWFHPLVRRSLATTIFKKKTFIFLNLI